MALLCLVLVVVFVALLFIAQNENVQIWYQTYQEYLYNAEQSVENMDDKLSVFFVIIFLYLFKSMFPIYMYPLSPICAITSAVFPEYLSIPINLVGLFILYSWKYYWGTKVGASGVQSLMQKSETVQYFIERDGRGNPWLLALFRLIPGIPINLVSKLYGAMGFPYKKYIILSLLGYSPLLISYTFIGRNVFNPLSARFIVPLMILFAFAGCSLFAISKIVQIQIKRRKTNG